jgi:lysine-N-methylase
MLEILTNRTRPLQCRLDSFLSLADAAQPLLDEDAAEELPALAAEFEGGCEVQTPVCCDLKALSALEVLEPDWREVLLAAESAPVQPQPEPLLERIAVYFAFRYLLKTVNDGDLLSRAQFVVYGVRAVERLAAVCGLSEALRRFSAEVEHSDENLEALLETLRWGLGN